MDKWTYEELVIWVLSYVESNPGIWTAKLCRLINDLPETEQSVIHCGYCSQYANPRKRERAAKFAAIPTLPGLEPPHQLHGPCLTMPLRRLQGILYKLQDVCLMIVSDRMAVIPDTRNHRGWDFATRWWPT